MNAQDIIDNCGDMTDSQELKNKIKIDIARAELVEKARRGN